MNWADNIKRIRRYLRDQDGNIWTDAFLKNSYNDAQRSMVKECGGLERVESCRYPSRYSMSYLFDWEYAYCHEGKRHRALIWHQQSKISASSMFEVLAESYSTDTVSDVGWGITHPWEIAYAGNKKQPVPVLFPSDFDKGQYIAWDKDPIEYRELKLIQSEDPSWRTRSGNPQYYTRLDSQSNEYMIYPMPSTITWKDLDGESGMVLYDEDVTATGETGRIGDVADTLFGSESGIMIDRVDPDGNLLLLYEAKTTDISGGDDEGSFPVWFEKYLMADVLERAYSANTDGKIDSLRDYWKWRKELGVTVIKQITARRRLDRDYRLVSKGGGSSRGRRSPKLPDTYPAVYP